MGSRITRALSVTDRNRRINPSSQAQIKQFIRIMCSSMYGFLVYGVGFLTQHSNEAHQNCLSYISIAIVGSFVMNAFNQQMCMIIGWILITLQILIFEQKIRLMYTIGAFLVLLAVLTNLFNYFRQKNNINSFLNNLKPSTFILISNCLLTISHFSSHFIKVLRSQADGTQIQIQHNIGMKCMFCFLGFMIIALTFFGHIYIRNIRFTPLPLNTQIRSLLSIKWIKWLQIIILLIGIRSSFLSAQALQKCQSGIFLIIILIINLSILKLITLFVEKTIKKDTSIVLLKILTIVIGVLYLLTNFLNVSFYICYPLFLILNTLLINILINKVENEIRVNYILAFLIAFLLESNNLQHVHIQGSEVNINAHLIISGIFVPIGLFIGDALNYIKEKSKYREIRVVSDPQLDFQQR